MHLPNGTQIFLETSRATNALNATKITNAAEPVATVTNPSGANAVAAGDYLLVTNSVWGKLTNLVLRAKAATDNSITLEGIDTTDTNQFPAGGVSTLVKINSWTEIPCVQDLAQDGGEQQYYNYQCLADDREQQLPTFKSATSLTYTFAHEYDNPIYDVLHKAEDSGDVKALYMYVPRAKEIRMYSGVISFNDIPQTTMNEMETVSMGVALKGKFISVPVTTTP